jgi:DNA ligase-associated metallophosphoesterase
MAFSKPDRSQHAVSAQGALAFRLLGQTLRLLPEKAVYWVEASALLIADAHLGKSGHFRKNGIALPGEASGKDLLRLEKLLQAYCPRQVCFLGDLFHSAYNHEWEMLRRLIERYPGPEWHLVLGNHDILSRQDYQRAGLVLHEHLRWAPFRLVHEAEGQSPVGEGYLLSGHVHPGVSMVGAGRQRLRLPCFLFGQHAAILPAFGGFTGLAMLKPRPEDKVFVVAEDRVLGVR